ncbi:MAG: flavodoxin domain-containing protein [Candidatus Riflebacteria bacterium]|nr:flavodoxin domain-containing protein [Candidatus Riflebacteria bacterium]
MNSEIKTGIFCTGVTEWALKYFHGHELSITRGTSYNAYLIKDGEFNVLIDSVKAPHVPEFLKKLEAIVPLDKITHYVINHTEPDHSGAFTAIMAKSPNAKIICSRGGQKPLLRHYPGNWNIQPVKTGDEIKLHSKTLRFFEAQMLHWPDSMFTYCPEEKILFPNDAFGQHYASSSKFADDVDQCELWQEAMKYFANILTPFSGQIINKVNDFSKLGWPVEMICPSHGMIWRKNVTQIIEKYVEWASGKAEPGVVIIYDTIWGGTEKMARAISRGLDSANVQFRIFNAGTSDFNDVNTEILKYKGVLIGCPTLNNSLMPTIAPFLESLKGLRFVNKVGAAFGTYGWSGEGCARLEEFMKSGNISIVQQPIKANYNPNEEDLAKCEQFGKDFAEHLK